LEEPFEVCERGVQRRFARFSPVTLLSCSARHLLNAMACSKWNVLKSRNLVSASNRDSALAIPSTVASL